MPDTSADRASIIRSFLNDYFQDYNFEDDEDIFSVGFIESMFAMQLVLFLEKRFDISVEDEDLSIENFRTVSAMDHFVAQKQQAA